MRAIVKNIMTMWNVCGRTAEGYMNAAKRELGEFQWGWMEAEEYLREHPESRVHDCQF